MQVSFFCYAQKKSAVCFISRSSAGLVVITRRCGRGCRWYQPGGPRAHHALQLPLLCHRGSALFPINALRRWSWGYLIEMAHRESHPGARFFSDPNEFLGRENNGATHSMTSFDCRPTVFQIIKPASFPSGRPYPIVMASSQLIAQIFCATTKEVNANDKTTHQLLILSHERGSTMGDVHI